MDILVFLLFSILFIIFIDKKIKSKLITISFTSLNIILIALIAFCSENQIISALIKKIMGSINYDIFHRALLNKQTVLICSYSTYGAIFLFMIFLFIFTFIGNSIVVIVEIKDKLKLLIRKYKLNSGIVFVNNSILHKINIVLSNNFKFIRRLLC